MIYDLDSVEDVPAYCLEELQRYVNSLNPTIDFDERAKRLLLFRVTNAMIRAGKDSLRQFRDSYYVGVLQSARFILEHQSLIEFFVSVPDEHKDIEKWFKGGFIETRLKSATENRLQDIIPNKNQIPFKGMSDELLVTREKTVQKNFGILSRFSHATIHSTSIPAKCEFERLILIPIIEAVVDAQRMVFNPKDWVTGMKFSEFRVYFSSEGKTRQSEQNAAEQPARAPQSQSK